MKKNFLWIFPILLCILLSGCESNTAGSEITSFADFEGKKIGVQTGTLYEDLVYDKVENPVIEFFTDPNTMLISLSQGKLDAYVADRAASFFERKSYPDVAYLEEPLGITPLSVGIAETSKKALLTQQVNEFVAKFRSSGEADELEAYWIESGDEDNNKTDRSGITGENGKLIIAMEGNFVPFSYMNNQLIEGYDVDFIYRFCREYGYEPVIEPMEYDALVPMLASGKCDLATSILYDEEREEEIILSDAYYDAQIILGYFGTPVEKGSALEEIAESFNKTFIKDSRWKQFVNGAVTTFTISASSLILGTLLGLLLYAICRKRGKIINTIVDKISWLVEGTPTVLLIMIFYFIIFGSVNVEKIFVAIVVFTIIFTDSMFYMLKSGEAAVGHGQLETALSQGFSEFAAYFRIVLPQSAIHFLPQYSSEVVSLIKETSIVGYIAILDLTKTSDMIRGRTFEPFFPLISTAIIYFLLSWLLTVWTKKLYRALCPETRSLQKKFKGLKTKNS